MIFRMKLDFTGDPGAIVLEALKVLRCLCCGSVIGWYDPHFAREFTPTSPDALENVYCQVCVIESQMRATRRLL